MAAPMFPPGAWPRLMSAAMAAAYCGETSAEAFRRNVGIGYPLPVHNKGSRQRWLREDLDAAIDRIAGRVPSQPTSGEQGMASTAFDAASVL